MRKLLVALAIVAIVVFSISLSAAANAKEGETTFKSKCAMCHGPDGSGQTPMGKNLKLRDMSSKEVQAQSDAELTTIITKGKNKMPAFGDKLSKDQVADIVAFVRTLKK